MAVSCSNCVANGKTKEGILMLWIQPAAGDAGEL